jgi:hypothetical protein
MFRPGGSIVVRRSCGKTASEDGIAGFEGSAQRDAGARSRNSERRLMFEVTTNSAYVTDEIQINATRNIDRRKHEGVITPPLVRMIPDFRLKLAAPNTIFVRD